MQQQASIASDSEIDNVSIVSVFQRLSMDVACCQSSDVQSFFLSNPVSNILTELFIRSWRKYRQRRTLIRHVAEVIWWHARSIHASCLMAVEQYFFARIFKQFDPDEMGVFVCGALLSLSPLLPPHLPLEGIDESFSVGGIPAIVSEATASTVTQTVENLCREIFNLQCLPAEVTIDIADRVIGFTIPYSALFLALRNCAPTSIIDHLIEQTIQRKEGNIGPSDLSVGILSGETTENNSRISFIDLAALCGHADLVRHALGHTSEYPWSLPHGILSDIRDVCYEVYFWGLIGGNEDVVDTLEAHISNYSESMRFMDQVSMLCHGVACPNSRIANKCIDWWLKNNPSRPLNTVRDEQGRPLAYYAARGTLEIMKRLLAVGCLPYTEGLPNCNNCSPVLQACNWGHVDILRLLIHRGGMHGVTPCEAIISAIEFAQFGNSSMQMSVDCVRYLLDRAVTDNVPPYSLLGSLPWAASHWPLNHFKWLFAELQRLTQIDARALVSQAKAGDVTCIQGAIYWNNCGVLAELFAICSPEPISNMKGFDECSSMIDVALRGNPVSLAILLTAGTDPAAYQKQVLEAAEMGGNRDCTKLLNEAIRLRTLGATIEEMRVHMAQFSRNLVNELPEQLPPSIPPQNAEVVREYEAMQNWDPCCPEHFMSPAFLKYVDPPSTRYPLVHDPQILVPTSHDMLELADRLANERPGHHTTDVASVIPDAALQAQVSNGWNWAANAFVEREEFRCPIAGCVPAAPMKTVAKYQRHMVTQHGLTITGDSVFTLHSDDPQPCLCCPDRYCGRRWYSLPLVGYSTCLSHRHISLNETWNNQLCTGRRVYPRRALFYAPPDSSWTIPPGGWDTEVYVSGTTFETVVSGPVSDEQLAEITPVYEYNRPSSRRGRSTDGKRGRVLPRQIPKARVQMNPESQRASRTATTRRVYTNRKERCLRLAQCQQIFEIPEAVRDPVMVEQAHAEDGRILQGSSFTEAVQNEDGEIVWYVSDWENYNVLAAYSPPSWVTCIYSSDGTCHRGSQIQGWKTSSTRLVNSIKEYFHLDQSPPAGSARQSPTIDETDESPPPVMSESTSTPEEPPQLTQRRSDSSLSCEAESSVPPSVEPQPINLPQNLAEQVEILRSTLERERVSGTQLIQQQRQRIITLNGEIARLQHEISLMKQQARPHYPREVATLTSLDMIVQHLLECVHQQRGGSTFNQT